MVAWKTICKSKIKGGLGIKDISKWWWKLDTENGLWEELVEKKYLKGNPISVVKHRLDDSPIWIDLLKIREVYLRGRVIQVANGKKNFVLEGCLVAG